MNGKDRIITVLRTLKCTQQELADGLALTPGTVNHYVCLLRREGRVAADRHPLDKRSAVYRAAETDDHTDA